MSIGFINTSIEELVTQVTNINKPIIIKTNKTTLTDTLKKILDLFLKINQRNNSIESLTDNTKQHQMFKVFIYYLHVLQKANSSFNEDDYLTYLDLFTFENSNDRTKLINILNSYNNNPRMFDEVFKKYNSLVIDKNSADFKPNSLNGKDVFSYFSYIMKVLRHDVNETGTVVNNSPTGEVVTGVVPGLSNTPSAFEFGSSGITSWTPDKLPEDFFSYLTIYKTGSDTEDYYYKDKKISHDDMEKIIDNNQHNERFNILLNKIKNKPTAFPSITKEDKKEIIKTVNNVFDLEKFNDNLTHIHTTLHSFLKNITDIGNEKSYEYHLLQLESFLAALEKFEKKIDIKPFEPPQKINMNDLKASIPTEPISDEKLEKLEIKSATVTKLLEELNKKDTFKKIDEILYGEKHEEYLSNLHKMNYNNGKVLYNSMGIPNTYTSGIYSISTPNNLSKLSTNYSDPILLEVVKPLIAIFSSDSGITKNPAFKTYSKWLKRKDIRDKIIEHFAHSDTFVKLRNFAIVLHELYKDEDTRDLFSDTGYYDDQIDDNIGNMDPMKSVITYVTQVKAFEKKYPNKIDKQLYVYFKKVIHPLLPKARWIAKGEEDETFVLQTLK